MPILSPKSFFFLILSSMVAPPNTLRAHEQQPHFQTFNSSHTGSRIPRSSLPNPVRVRLDSSEQNFGPPVPRPVHTHTHTPTHMATHTTAFGRKGTSFPSGGGGGRKYHSHGLARRPVWVSILPEPVSYSSFSWDRDNPLPLHTPLPSPSLGGGGRGIANPDVEGSPL